jgi:hypothetical protein
MLEMRKRRQQVDDEATELFDLLTSSSASTVITVEILERALRHLPIQAFKQGQKAQAEAAKMMDHALRTIYGQDYQGVVQHGQTV